MSVKNAEILEVSPGGKWRPMTIIDHSIQHDYPTATAAPGVDVVFSTSQNAEARVLDGKTLRLIGALHRRFWARRRELLLRRAQSVSTMTGLESESGRTVDGGSTLIDLTGPEAQTWEGRIAEYLRLIELVGNDQNVPNHIAGVPNVVIRGWAETEPGVLVDGRAVPGCVVDMAVALSAAVDAFRRDENPFVLAIPKPGCDEEAKLWADLANSAQDRAGIDRGTVGIDELPAR